MSVLARAAAKVAFVYLVLIAAVLAGPRPAAAWQPDGAAAAADRTASRTASPYFAVDSTDAAADRLPLKSTQVDVRILGVLADVTVTQRYRNEGQRPLEARYVFPGSTRAAVHAMQVRLGDRVLTAQIREKHQAQAEYEQAKAEGKTAALLEQHRPNVFQMHVANILPGDDVRVELRYTELLVPTAGVYEFVFPTVVGPRYAGADGDGSGEPAWWALPFLPEGRQSPAAFALDVRLVTPTGVRDLRSPSHRIEPQPGGPQETRVALAPTGFNENDRDFVLQYRLAGDRIETGLLLSAGGAQDEKFFLALVEPPKRVATDQIVPREYVFVIDVSGSMHGFPLDTAKTLMRQLLGGLRPTDTFNLLLFAGDNTVFAPASVPATPDQVERAIRVLDAQAGGGGTELLPALRTALAMPAPVDRARSFVVLTDGYVTVEREAFSLVRQNLGKANLFAFGIGSAVNRHLIEGLARAGQSEPFVVLDANAAEAATERFRTLVAAPVLSRVRARFAGLDVYDVEPMTLPDVFAERPVVLFGKWRGPAQGTLTVEGHAADGPFRAVLPVRPELARPENAALRYLWARHRIASLSDDDDLDAGGQHRDAILQLGLRYHLLTQYTSFVAVDQRVRNPDAAATATVDQPSPLPAGVSHLAVGGHVPSTPEPAAWAMLLLATAGLGVLAWRRRGLAAN